MTPPKTILDKTLTLVESKCVPSALLHFGTDEEIVNTQVLKQEYYSKLSTGSGASKILLANKSQNHQDEQNQPSTSAQGSKSTTSVPKNFMESKVSSKPTGAIPKWFKSNK